jgi:hypothetical protein
MKHSQGKWRLLAAALVVGCLLLPEAYRLATRPASVRTEPVAETPTMAHCETEASATVQLSGHYFTDVTDEVGMDFVHTPGPLGSFYMPEVNGSGGAFFDCDNDGDLDLVLINCGRSPKAPGEFPPGTITGNRLYRRESNGRYTDVTDAAGLRDAGYGVGCAVADVDNDGDLDLYVTAVGPDHLFENNGSGEFTDVSRAAGIDNPEYSTGAAFFDYDRDGWLDLIVVNYVSDPLHDLSVGCGFPDHRVSYCGPLKFEPTIDRLYHNEGLHNDESGTAHVRFRDVTVESGLAASNSNGFCAICLDCNRDGWPDIFIANDMRPNRLWINQRNGTFVEEAIPRGVAFSGGGRPQAGMGAALGDFDSDGDFDLVSTHMQTEYTALYENDGAGVFQDSSTRSQIVTPTAPHTGWGVAAVDFDHDGQLDLAIANGLVVPCRLNFPPHGEEEFILRAESISDTAAFWRDYYDRNVLLLNEGRGRFGDASSLAGDFVGIVGSARALICGDFDDDGDIDFVVTSCGGRARLFRNDVPKRGHWLQVRAIDPALGREALGAEIEVATAERRFLGIVQPAGSYLSSHDSRAHFGLGGAERYQQIVVQWADGFREMFAEGLTDRFLTLHRGSGTPLERDPAQ